MKNLLTLELANLLKRLASSELEACVKAALNAGDAIINFESVSIKDKGDAFVKHHAIVTEADLRSQEIIFQILFEAFPDSYVIAEEESERFAKFKKRMLAESNYLDKIRDNIFIIDSLDGTSNYSHVRWLGQWGISISYMKNLEQEAGALYFPIRDLLVFAVKGKGAYKVEKGRIEKAKVRKEDLNTRNQFTYFGVDAPFSGLSRFLEIYSGNTRTANTNGSCALGMAMIAVGEADVLVQPLQRIWDPPAGYLAIKEAGGEVIWYTITGLKKDKEGKVLEWGKVRRVDKPKDEHYNPAKKELGFVAASSKRIANYWFDILKETYGK